MKIAHISDFHLRHHLPGHSLLARRRSRLMPALLRLALNQIAAHRPDLLAVTGDLVDFPFYAMDDRGAIAQGHRDLQLIRTILDQAPCPVAYVYGNHDHPASFRDVFADQALDRTAGDYRLLTFLDGEVRDNTAERLGESLTLFEVALADADPRPQIHLQHYMVFPERDQGYPHSYREATALHEACAASGKVHLSLSGHFHRGENLQQHDGVHYATARAFCEAPHPFRVYELDGTTIAETEYYVETPAEGNRGLFIECEGILDQIAAVDADRAALHAALAAGLRLVAIVRDRKGITIMERASDALAGWLDSADIPLAGLCVRFDRPDSAADAPEPLLDACHQLGLDPARSGLIARSPEEFAGGQAADFAALQNPTSPADFTKAIASAIDALSP